MSEDDAPETVRVPVQTWIRQLDRWADAQGQLERARRKLLARTARAPRPRRLWPWALVALGVTGAAFAGRGLRDQPQTHGAPAARAPEVASAFLRRHAVSAPVRARPRLAAAAPDPDLVGHWPFDDQAQSGGWTLDSSGNGNHARLDGPRGHARLVPGRRGGALNVGPSGYGTVLPSPSLDAITHAFTISAWVLRDADGAMSFDMIASRQTGDTHGEHLGLGCYLNQLTLLIETRPPELTLRDWGLVPNGRWVHVAATWDGQVAVLYLDGEEIARAPRTGLIKPDKTPLLLGANRNRGGAVTEQFLGSIDDLRIYKRALRGDEIVQLLAD